jgi:hypothetical protein
MLFDGFIVRDDCIASWDAVRSHPNVKHVVSLPRDWLFYEFHHELFSDPDFLVESTWLDKMERFPKLKNARMEMLRQQRSLLAPWYAKKKRIGDADAGVPGETSMYRISTLGSMRWIPSELPRGWDSATRFTLNLEIAGSEPSPVLLELLDEWIATSTGQISAPDGARSEADSVCIEVNFHTKSGPWLAILWVLLSDARWKNGVKKLTTSLHAKDR